MGVEGPRQQQLGEQRRVPVGDAGAADGALLGEDLACRLVDRGDAELAERIQHRRLAAARRAGQHEVVVHRSEEHTSELQSLMRISYAVFCLNKKTQTNIPTD